MRQQEPSHRRTSRRSDARPRLPRNETNTQDGTTFSEERWHILDSYHSYTERSLTQDGNKLSPVTAKQSHGGLTQERNSEVLSPHGTAPQAPSQNTEGDDDQEWSLLGARPLKRKRNPLTPGNTGASKPIPQLTQTVVLRFIGRKEVSASRGHF